MAEHEYALRVKEMLEVCATEIQKRQSSLCAYSLQFQDALCSSGSGIDMRR